MWKELYLGHIFLVIIGIAPLIDAGLVNKESHEGYYDDSYYDDGYYNDGYGDKDNGKDSPVISSKSEHFEFDNGGTIKLHCHVHKLQDEIAIMWKKIDDEKKTISLIAIDDKIIDPKYLHRTTVTVDDKGSTLTIGQSEYGDSGKYQCELGLENNPPQINHTVTIIPRTLTCRPSCHADYWVNALEAPPSVAVANNFIYKDVGDMVEIVCIVQAVPIPEIDWVKDGQELKTSNRFKISQFGNEHTLSISPIQKRDFGTYICKASNPLGIEEQIIELKGIDDSETEEIWVEIGLSPSGHWESLKMVSSKKAKGLHPFIGKETVAVDLLSLRVFQTEGGWIAMIVPYSKPVAAVTVPLTSTASTVTITSMVLLFCFMFLMIMESPVMV